VRPGRDPSDPVYNPTLINSIVDNSVLSYFMQNVTASSDFASATSAEVWMSVNNVRGKDPPFSAGTTGGVNGVFYDTPGRTYRVGVRLNFRGFARPVGRRGLESTAPSDSRYILAI
jgi:hypothetical protein